MIDIKKIREERGLTQSQLADALNNNKINTDDDEIVSQEMVSRYEKDWKNIPAWFAYRIIKFTGENPIDLFGNDWQNDAQEYLEYYAFAQRADEAGELSEEMLGIGSR